MMPRRMRPISARRSAILCALEIQGCELIVGCNGPTILGLFSEFGFDLSAARRKEAQRAGVGYLLLNHIVPTLPYQALDGPFLGQARANFSGSLTVGRDGDFISMPAGSKINTLSNRMR